MAAPNRDLGPCCVVWDPAGDNIELSPTFGGVEFRDEVLSVDIHEDGQGETIVDSVHTGRVVEVTVPMTRYTLTQLEAAIKGSVAAASKLEVSNKVGGAVFADAKELIIKPAEDNVCTPTTTEWLHVHKAYPFANLGWMYDNSGQRVANILFKCYPDTASGQVGEMWRMGPDA